MGRAVAAVVKQEEETKKTRKERKRKIRYCPLDLETNQENEN